MDIRKTRNTAGAAAAARARAPHCADAPPCACRGAAHQEAFDDTSPAVPPLPFCNRSSDRQRCGRPKQALRHAQARQAHRYLLGLSTAEPPPPNPGMAPPPPSCREGVAVSEKDAAPAHCCSSRSSRKPPGGASGMLTAATELRRQGTTLQGCLKRVRLQAAPGGAPASDAWSLHAALWESNERQGSAQGYVCQ